MIWMNRSPLAWSEQIDDYVRFPYLDSILDNCFNCVISVEIDVCSGFLSSLARLHDKHSGYFAPIDFYCFFYVSLEAWAVRVGLKSPKTKCQTVRFVAS